MTHTTKAREEAERIAGEIVGGFAGEGWEAMSNCTWLHDAIAAALLSFRAEAVEEAAKVNDDLADGMEQAAQRFDDRERRDRRDEEDYDRSADTLRRYAKHHRQAASAIRQQAIGPGR